MSTYLLPYTQGTISVENGSTAVVGAVTAWVSEAMPGDWLIVDGERYTIASVEGNTALTLLEDFAGSTDSGLSYAIHRVSRGWGDASRNNLRLAEIFTAMQRGFTMTSLTEVEIGDGPHEMIVPSGMPILPGARLLFTSRANPDTHWFLGRVAAYEGQTLTVAEEIVGSGEGDSRTDWNVNIAGVKGSQGEPGDDGDDGDVGPAWITSFAAWSPGEFTAGQGVQHGGSSYRANTTTSQEPPHADWDLIAAKGEDGEDGDDGEDGADGIIASVVEGENIEVDATDPANPIVATKPFLLLTEDDAPATPAAGKVALYAKADHKLYSKDDEGNETEIGAGGGGMGPLQGYIAGLRLSNNPTDANNDIDVGAGVACADDQSAMIHLLSSLTKRLDAAWAVGTNQGGLDTGSEATSTWYHVWLIQRSDTDVVDVLFSTSASSPTMPANYDRKRRIGAVFNNASGNIKPFNQFGSEFLWVTPVEDVAAAANPGTSAVLRTLSVPTGVKVWARITVAVVDTTTPTDVRVYISSPDQDDGAPALALTNFGIFLASAPGTISLPGQGIFRTNTSAQLRSRMSSSDAGHTLTIGTHGWYDLRGAE